MRYLIHVLEQIQSITPPEEGAFLAELRRLRRDHLYSAPEMCNWHSVAGCLQSHLRHREDEPWVRQVLSVWRDEKSRPAVEVSVLGPIICKDCYGRLGAFEEPGGICTKCLAKRISKPR